MKRKLHLFSLLFLAAFLLAPVRTMAQVTIGDYTYTFSGDDATITASSLTSGDIVIPTTVSYNGKTYNVTAINYSTVLFNNWNGQKITSIKGESIKSITGGQSYNAGMASIYMNKMDFCSSYDGCISIDFPHLKELKNCSFLRRANSLTSLNLPLLESIEHCYQVFTECSSLASINLSMLKRIDASQCLYQLPALTSLELPEFLGFGEYVDRVISEIPLLTSLRLPKWVTVKKGDRTIYNLPKLQILEIPELTSIGVSDYGDCNSIMSGIGIQRLDAPKLRKVYCTFFLVATKISEVNLPYGCEINSSGMLGKADGTVSSITVNGVTKINDKFFALYGYSTLKSISLPDVEEFSGGQPGTLQGQVGMMCEGLESFSAPKLRKLTNLSLFQDNSNTNLVEVDIHSLEEVVESKLFSQAPLRTLKFRGDLKVDANSSINLNTYPTVVTITDEGTVNDIPASAFANVKGGRFIVPKGKAALYAQKWNLNTSKTMVYAPVDLKKTTAGTLYASGSITKADDSFTYGGTVYNNQYDFSHAMTEAECKNPSVLGDNDLGFTPTLSSLTVQNNTNALAGYNFYYASAYADSPTQAKVGDLTLTALPSDNAGTLQGFGTAAAQLNKGVSRAMGGFLFRGNSASVDEVYLPYTPSAVSLTTNLLQAGGGVTVKSRSGSNYDFYWHPGNAAYAAGFYECDNTMIPEYRASLSFPKTLSSNAKQFRLIFEDGETTGIESIVLPSDNARTADPEAWYTLLGTRLPAKPATAGVYIHGGRKVVVK